MYPKWPESDADLVPLPNIPGPKLKPFDFGGPQNIEFLEDIGEGRDAMVFKVRILGHVYALKVFRWVLDIDWTHKFDFVDRQNHEQMSAVYNYMEPFNNECRAYGRLHESGHEDVAVRSFGYVLLDEEHERVLMSKFNFHHTCFNGDIYSGDDGEQRSRFLGKDDRPPPLRCIVKALGHDLLYVDDQADCFRGGAARRWLGDIIKLQKLGIMNVDPAIVQFVDGKITDFSTAITMPHFITSPELNPNLTPDMIDVMRRLTFQHCANDYLDFDRMIHGWNFSYGAEKGHMSFYAYPGGEGSIGRKKYNLRSMKTSREPGPYTFVDPRKYGWTASPVNGGTSRAPTPKRRQSARISKNAKRKVSQGDDSKPQHQRRLTSRPDMWHYDYTEKEKKWASK